MKKKIVIIIIIILIILILLLFSSPVVRENIITRYKPNPEIVFSDVVVNGIKDHTILEDEKTLSFTATLKSKGEKHKIEYKVSNNSKKLKSKVEIECSKDTDFLKITNKFDEEKELEIGEVRNGELTIELKKVAMKEETQTVKCVIKETEIKK